MLAKLTPRRTWKWRTPPHPALPRMHQELDSLLEGFLGGTGLNSSDQGFADIKLDVKETAEALLVTADLPGLTEEQVHVTFEDDLLTISTTREESKEEDEGTYHLRERLVGSVSRTLRFPMAVDQDNLAAVYDNGVLTVTLPKAKEETEKVRRIPVARPEN